MGTTLTDLKSNMDRFIETSKKFFIPTTKYLKSNMDRFIVLTCQTPTT